jgi:hypothetical protein
VVLESSNREMQLPKVIVISHRIVYRNFANFAQRQFRGLCIPMSLIPESGVAEGLREGVGEGDEVEAGGGLQYHVHLPRRCTGQDRGIINPFSSF